MKYIKLILKNFLPYYGEENEIQIYDKNIRNKNVTLNIGPNGNGKTSISHAIMWCLFGESYKPQWEFMVNKLAIEIAKQNNFKSVKTSVELEIEIEGVTYLILRVGSFNIDTGKREDDTNLFIRTNGVLIKGDPLKFINEYFPPVNLMEYFIFDADRMLSLFEENQEKTIKDHINKIVGVETLDIMSESLKNVIELYAEEIHDIQINSPGVHKSIVNIELQKIELKKQAIKSLYAQKKGYEDQKKELFPKGHLSPEEINLNDVMNNIHDAEENINELNSQLENDPDLISNIYLLFLKDIIEETIILLNNTNTTKSEFDSAANILKSTLEGKYSGILINNDPIKLIRRNIIVKEAELESIDKLTLEKGSGIKSLALQEMNDYNRIANESAKKFFELQRQFNITFLKLTQSREILKQIGNTEKNIKLKGKIEEFLGIDRKIQELQPIIEKAERELAQMEETFIKLRNRAQVTEENQKRIDNITKNIEKIKYMITNIEESKKIFLKELLEEVNKEATKFFNGVKRGDDPRLNSIEVDVDYKLYIKNDLFEKLDPETISKGNTQIALMAFFFGLSKYLKNKLPYIMDDPLIRLDIGHDKRLIQHLCNSEQQIIMHLIPGKEYTEYHYKYFKPYINTQNWINRKRSISKSINMLCSYVESKDSTKFIEFDIEKL